MVILKLYLINCEIFLSTTCVRVRAAAWSLPQGFATVNGYGFGYLRYLTFDGSMANPCSGTARHRFKNYGSAMQARSRRQAPPQRQTEKEVTWRSR